MKLKLGLSLVLLFPALAFAQNARIELVESIPVETNLAVDHVLETRDAWVQLINAAKSTIDMEEFYLSNQAGSQLDSVMNALQAASARGVKLRVLVDSKFFVNYASDAKKLGALPGAELKTIDFAKTDGVMHAKYFVVDGKLAYLGSANFDWLALEHIHEIGLKVNDAAISQSLLGVFNFDWNSSSTQRISGTESASTHSEMQNGNVAPGFYASPISLEPTGIPPTLSGLIDLINSATKSLKIQNYEYNTSVYHSNVRFTDLDSAIRAAAARGVKVEFLLDQNALKVGTSDLKALVQVPNVSIKIIRIPAWSGGPLAYARLAHSKYCIVDEAKAWTGSENWSSGYFKGSRNVGLIFDDAVAVSQLNQVFGKLSGSAYVKSF